MWVPGLVLNLLAYVSLGTKVLKNHFQQYFFPSAIECPALTAPMNGQVSYATDMTAEFEIGTVATFTCDAGFSLNGAAAMLTCTDDDQMDDVGTWGGIEPTCLRKSR